MKNELKIFIDGNRLDTNGSDSISIKKTVKDLKSIDTVFTSFSRSITIPASKSNNRIFKHYYEADIVNTFDARALVNAELVLGFSTIDKGNIALEGVELRDGLPVNYKIRFYGGLTELKKRLSEDYIHNLDTSADNLLSPDYTTILSESLTSSPAVAFCLSSSENRFIYHSDDADYAATEGFENTKNIAFVDTIPQHQYGVTSDEIVATYRVGSILDAIESRYNLSLTGAIRAPYVEDYRVLLNSASRKNELGINEYIDYTLSTNSFTVDSPVFDGVYDGQYALNNPNVVTLASASGNSIQTTSDFEFSSGAKKYVDDRTPNNMIGTSSSLLTQTQLRVCVTTSLTNFELDVKKDGETIATITESQAQQTSTNYSTGTDLRLEAKDFGGQGTWTFELRAAGNGTVQVSYRFGFKHSLASFYNSLAPQEQFTSYDSFTFSTSATGDDFVNVSALMPKMKVKDFLGTITKQFNLIPEVQDATQDTIAVDYKHYDYYINQGNTYEITEYVDIDKQYMSPSNTYNGVSFEHKAPKSAMQEAFFKVNRRHYGELEANLEESDSRITGEQFKVKMLNNRIPMERLNDLNDESKSNIQWLQLTDLNSNKVDVGIVFLYCANADNTSIAFDNGTTVAELNNPILPTNMYYPSQSISASFGLCGNYYGEEINEYFGDSRYNGLGNFNCFWQSYIDLMFDSRTRRLELSAHLPHILNLSLNNNDILVIKDKMHLIESLETNFGTGITKLSLIQIPTGLFDNFEAHQIAPENDVASAYVYLKSTDGQLGLSTSSTLNAIGSVKNNVEL